MEDIIGGNWQGPTRYGTSIFRHAVKTLRVAYRQRGETGEDRKERDKNSYRIELHH